MNTLIVYYSSPSELEKFREENGSILSSFDCIWTPNRDNNGIYIEVVPS